MNYNKYIEYFNKTNHFMRYNGMQIVVLEEGYAEVDMELTNNSLNPQGTLHGGAIFTLGDVAAGAAAKSHGLVNFTLNGTINFIKAIKTGKVKAIANEIHRGKTTGVYKVDVIDENKNLISSCTFTMFFTGTFIDI